MQLVHITLTPLQRRNRVAFAVTSLDAAHPDTGEHVVVRDQSGAYFGALVVASSYDEHGRGTHRLRLGASLPETIAERRLARPDFLAPAADVLHEQVEQFLAEAAAFRASFGSGETVPPQR
jgi:hypothetical protein